MAISFLSCLFIADLIMIKREGKVKNYEGSREDWQGKDYVITICYMQKIKLRFSFEQIAKSGLSMFSNSQKITCPE